ncbi:hypothetical protein [Lacihabitans lacunae]|uniref:Lipoprotein n=1 Tax=Lacihabitans lacunae TaxID=1028214 RepID=A0ABV7Z4W0_9BACT
MNLIIKVGQFIAIGLLITGCNKNLMEENPIANLYPEIKIGQIKEYKIIELTQTAGKEIQDQYFIKEVVTDTVRFNQELYFVKTIYKSGVENGLWVFLETEFEYKNLKGVFLKKDNSHVQKVGFPVGFSTTWKINQRIESLENNTAKYLDFKTAYTVGNENWADGYVVQVEKDSTGIHNFQEKEYYSPKYGLISSLKRTIFYCQDNANCLGKNIEESNKTITKTLQKITR